MNPKPPTIEDILSNHAMEYRAGISKLASEVFSDMPGANIDKLMAEAMKRNKGSMSPRMLNEAFYELMNPRPTPAKNDD